LLEVDALHERIGRLEAENQTLRERVADLVDEKYRLQHLCQEYAPSWVFE
jgi:predicted nuclease with TOPRIM domain